jgi:hypothetical protein
MSAIAFVPDNVPAEATAIIAFNQLRLNFVWKIVFELTMIAYVDKYVDT